jgi:hypothetical protein
MPGNTPRLLLACIFLCAAPRLAPASSRADITRISAQLNGVFSPRGYFNILVRLQKVSGAQAAKLDLAQSKITVDFAPGVQVTPAEMQDILVQAGYRPGPVSLKTFPKSQARETGNGWIPIKHPTSHNGLVRWAQQNF